MPTIRVVPRHSSHMQISCACRHTGAADDGLVASTVLFADPVGTAQLLRCIAGLCSWPVPIHSGGRGIGHGPHIDQPQGHVGPCAQAPSLLSVGVGPNSQKTSCWSGAWRHGLGCGSAFGGLWQVRSGLWDTTRYSSSSGRCSGGKPSYAYSHRKGWHPDVLGTHHTLTTSQVLCSAGA